jgi:hypothetical protein
MLRNHLKRYGTAPDGRIFRTVRGGLIQDSAYSAVWQEALTNVHDSGGTLDGGDNDTNLEITPRADFAGLLTNRHGRDNQPQGGQDPVIECEVNVGSDWRSQYEFFVNSLVGHEVTAQGVFVDDDGHDSKTELHPMDVIFARVDDSQLPGDWGGALITQRGLVLDQSLFVTRFAGASDDREGVFLSGPPLASWDRPTAISLPLPPVPPGTGWTPDFSLHMLRQDKATVDTAVVGDPGSGSQAIQLTITCQGRDYGASMVSRYYRHALAYSPVSRSPAPPGSAM